MKIPSVGMLFYLSKIDKTEISDYVPMNKEVFNDLRSFEPSKMTLDYEDYIRLVDKPTYERTKIINESNTGVKNFIYNIGDVESKLRTKNRILEIENSTEFISWLVNEEVLDVIRN